MEERKLANRFAMATSNGLRSTISSVQSKFKARYEKMPKRSSPTKATVLVAMIRERESEKRREKL